MFGLLPAAKSQADSQAQSTSAIAPVFEVASIKPNKSGSPYVKLMFPPSGLTATNVTLHGLIRAAYGVEDNQVSGAPKWLNSEKYDIEAKMDSAVAAELRKLGEDRLKLERQRMLQALLADRFKLMLHREAKELPVYVLVIAKNGPKLHKSKAGETYANGMKLDGLPAGPGYMQMKRGELMAQGIPIASLVRPLSAVLGRSVLDKTGLKGTYDVVLHWTPDESLAPMFRSTEGGLQGAEGTASLESSGPSIFTAVQEQLGMKLESQKGPAEVLVIDHVEKPSEN